MSLIVQKFGGSSVADPEKIRRVAKRVGETADKGNKVVVVVSAMGDTTDDLIALAKKINIKLPAREMDMLLSTGEQQSIALLSMALLGMGYKAISLTGEQAGVQTDKVYGKAKITYITPTRLEEELAKGNIVIVTGFQGVDAQGDVHTLGRGGSDTSAVALAIGLNADYCEIYTDVDGVYTADPRVVPKAQKLSTISFDEMMEMASLGAGVLQPRSVEVAKRFNMPICVRSSFNYNEGTMVQEVKDMKNLENEITISGVACDNNVLKITVFEVPDYPGTAAQLFTVLGQEKVNVDMIVQSGDMLHATNISFTTGQEDKTNMESILQEATTKIGANGFMISDDIAKVSIVGAGMITNPGVAAKMFQVLADNNINIEMISTSEIKVSCVVKASEAKKAVLALHTAFKLDAE